MSTAVHELRKCAMLAAAAVLLGCAAAPAQKTAGSEIRSASQKRQTSPAAAQATEQAKADANKLPAERGDVVDRLVAIVNGDIVLESDVEEEERFSKLYPYRITSGGTAREQAMTRLIDRELIIQQMRGVTPPVSDAQIAKDESDLRKDLPACAEARCTTDEGWKKFLSDAGFTEDELHDRLRLREEVLGFIEQRFRSGIRISDQQIHDYYVDTMLPAYAKAHATPPAEDVLSPRIEELLLQQRVSSLLDTWLKSLRESGSVRILKSGEDLP